MREWIRSELGVDHVDTITEPGCDLALHEKDRPDLRSKAEISVRAHGSRIIFVSGHHDCAANPADAGAQTYVHAYPGAVDLPRHAGHR